MSVENTLKGFVINELNSSAVVKLSGVLAHFWGYERKSQSLVEIDFIVAFNKFRTIEKAVLVRFEPFFLRHLADGDVVLLAPGEVGEGVGELLVRHDPQVHLHS